MSNGMEPPGTPRWNEETRPYPFGPALDPAPWKSSAGAGSGSSTSEPARSGEGDEPALDFGPYHLVARAGAGGMGVVWRARDPRLDRPIALKLLRSEATDSPEARERFLREARLTAHLRHPGIVAVRDFGEVEGRLFLAMDWVEGADWSHRLAELEFPLPAAQLREEVSRLAGVAEAVEHAHQAGILHRDLKPANVLIASDGCPQVTDFGLAKEVAGGPASAPPLTSGRDLLGTPAYMSPEQARGEAALGPATDVWSLGCILYHLLSGGTPFGDAGDSWQVLRAAVEQEVEPPRRRAPGVPADLEALCLHALDPDVRRRCPSAGEFAADLRRWLAGTPVHAPGRALGRVLRALRRRRLLVVAVLLAVLLGLAAGIARREVRARALQHLAEAESLLLRFDETRAEAQVTEEQARTLAEQTEALAGAALIDAPDLGAAYALRGYARHLLGRDVAADDDLERGCAHAGERASPFFLRGVVRLERYRRRRGLPQVLYGATGFDFVSARPESREELGLRERGLADLRRALASPDASVRTEDVRLMESVADFFDGSPEALARALRRLDGLTGRRALELRAETLYRCRRFTEACAAYDRLLALPRPDPAVRRGRAFAQFAHAVQMAADGRDAREWLRDLRARTDAILANDPADDTARFCRAECLNLLGDLTREHGGDAREIYAAALADYDELAVRRPADPLLLLQRAIALSRAAGVRGERSGDHAAMRAQALTALDEVVRLWPSSPEARNARGVAWLDEAEHLQRAGGDARKELDLARRDFDEALRLAPGMGEAASNRALLEILTAIAEERATGADPRPRLDRALRESAELIRRQPTFVGAAVGRAALLQERGQVEAERGGDPRATYRNAVEVLESALRLHAGHVDVLHGLGTVWNRLAQAEDEYGLDPTAACLQAIQHFSGALEHAPWRAGTWAGRANTRLRLARFLLRAGGEARDVLLGCIADADAALAAQPECRAPVLDRGLARVYLGEAAREHGADPIPLWEQAAIDLEDAVQERVPGSRVNLAFLLLQLRRPDRAIEILEAALREDPTGTPQAASLLTEARAQLRAFATRPWWAALEEANRHIRAGRYLAARNRLERLVADAEPTAPPTDAARTDLIHAHYNLACILAVFSTGRDAPAAEPKECAPGERENLRAAAFAHLGRAIDLGWRDAAQTDGDADLAWLRDDPRWAALRARLGD